MSRKTLNNSPFLANFPMPNLGRKRISSLEKFKRQLEDKNKHKFTGLYEAFQGHLFLSEVFKSNDKERRRFFTREITFWSFLYQVLTGLSCSGLVKQVQMVFYHKNRNLPSSNNSAYCQSRKKLPVSQLSQIFKQTSNANTHLKLPSELWWGREVKVVDGTSLSMPDTQANQENYPQHKMAKKGCGFPQLNAVGLFSLSTGVMHEFKTGNKYASEKTMWRDLWHLLEPGQIILGDRGFSGYAGLSYLKTNENVDSIMRMDRKIDPGNWDKVSKNEWLITIHKKRSCPKSWPQEMWAKVEDQRTFRIIKVKEYTPGFRSKDIYLITTLLEEKVYKAETIERLYMKRWAVEVFFRDAKTTLGMDCLSTKTPDMVEKEILMFCIAYNLIRITMAKAAEKQQISPYKISFKGCLNQISVWWNTFLEKSTIQIHRIMKIFYEKICDSPICIRPERTEPRAIKRRPKNHFLLTKPRHEMIITFHRGHPNRKNALNNP